MSDESTTPSQEPVNESMNIAKDGSVSLTYTSDESSMGFIPNYDFSSSAVQVQPVDMKYDGSNGYVPMEIDANLGTFAQAAQSMREGMEMGKLEIDPAMEYILTAVTNVSQDRVTYFRLLNEFEGHYLVNAMYDVLVDEVLRDTGEGIDLEVSSTDKKYDELAKQCIDKFNITTLIEQMIVPLLHYGDYTYKIVKYDEEAKDNKSGKIKEIQDEYVPGEIAPLYQGTTPIAYFHLPQVRTMRRDARAGNGVTDVMQQVAEVDFDSVLHFSLQSKKLKVELGKEAQDKIKTPQLYLGRSFVWSVIDKLQILKFREVAEAARELSTLTRPTLVGVQIPASETGKNAVAYCQKFEKLLNSGIQDPALQLQGTEGITSALSKVMGGRFKAIPQYASGRGDASKLSLEDQIRADDRTDEKLAKERELICNLKGIPPELVLQNQSTEVKSNHKVYARLARQVKAIQRSICRSVAQFIVHYIATELDDEDVSESDIRVVLRSATNIEDIDDAEAIGYIIDNVRNIVGVADEIKRAGLAGYEESPPPNPDSMVPDEPRGKSPIDPDKFMKYLRNEFKKAGSNAADIWIGSDDDEDAEEALQRITDEAKESDEDL